MEWSIPSTGKLYKRINDGTSDIWLDISSAGVGALNRSEEFIVGTPSNGYNGSTTTFPVAAGYIPGQLSVFVEGMKLNSDEYTATDGTNVILNVARIAGESVYVLAFGIFQSADHYTKAESDANIAAIPAPVYNDTLTSTSTTEGLTANQGKILNDTKIEATDYATSTVGGTVKARYDGGTSTLYFTIDGTDA